MRILLRALPIFLLMGLCTVSLAQSNNPSGSNPPGSGFGPDATVNTSNPGGTSPQNASIAIAGTQSTHGGVSSTPLTQQQIDNYNQAITLLQNQLQQINDPNDPKAIKLQETIDHLQEILNNQ